VNAAQIQPGESILIVGAAGAAGQAATQITLGLHLDDRSGRSTLPTAGLPHTTHTSGGEAPI